MNLEQIRAQHAFTAVTVDAPKGLLALARQLPEMLHTNGLLASWAFLLAKDRAEHKAVANALLSHLRDPGVGLVAAEDADRRSLFVEHWTAPGASLSTVELQRLTAEAIAYAGWLKRAAETLCTSGEGEEEVP